ncbi:hypothetical protein LARI1_G002376, partial [Lachnellula arida]
VFVNSVLLITSIDSLQHPRLLRSYLPSSNRTPQFNFNVMSIFTAMLDQWHVSLGAFFLLSSLAILVVGKQQRAAVLERLHIHRQRASGASTPPRSFSPDKKTGGSQGSSLPTSSTDFVNSFPPSRRSVLPELAKTASPENAKILLAKDTGAEILLKEALPTTRAYDLQNASPKYTPTGFSTAEIKAMAFNKIEPDWWLEVDNQYASSVKERQELFRQYGSKVLDFLPGSELVCKELMEMCLQFYCARYPFYFSLSSDKSTFHNKLLQTDTDIKSIHPLHVLLNNVPEDFGIVLRNEKDGMYYFRAGLICSSLGWNVGTKIGMSLQEIHQPIPDYKEKMSLSMDRIEECNLRVDWQTLRRLPLSGGIVFNFTALFTPVQEFRDEPYIPALCLKILKEGKKTLMEYKGTWHVEHICIPELEKYAREQVEKGLVRPENPDEEEWNPATLAENPFFPGWKEKWHRQQGF